MKLNEVVQQFIAELQKRPELTRINTFFRPTVPQLYVEVDEPRRWRWASRWPASTRRCKAPWARSTSTTSTRPAAYRGAVAGRGRLPHEAGGPGQGLRAQRASNAMIPLSAVSTVKRIVGPEQVERFNGFVAAKVWATARRASVRATPSGSSRRWPRATLPPATKSPGPARPSRKSAPAPPRQAFGFAIIMVFLILAAQYEKMVAAAGGDHGRALRLAGRADWPCGCAACRTTSTSRSAWWC
jgi:hypothetical protein